MRQSPSDVCFNYGFFNFLYEKKNVNKKHLKAKIYFLINYSLLFGQLTKKSGKSDYYRL